MERIDDDPDNCTWCPPERALPAYRNGLCRHHWDEAHDFFN